MNVIDQLKMKYPGAIAWSFGDSFQRIGMGDGWVAYLQSSA